MKQESSTDHNKYETFQSKKYFGKRDFLQFLNNPELKFKTFVLHKIILSDVR